MKKSKKKCTSQKPDYSNTYPKGFFKLNGSIKEGIEEPEDLPIEKEDFDI